MKNPSRFGASWQHGSSALASLESPANYKIDIGLISRSSTFLLTTAALRIKTGGPINTVTVLVMKGRSDMQGFKRLVAVATGLTMIGLTMAVFSAAPVHATPPATTQNVNVVNTPLPVQGDINVTVVGTPTVNVGNFPSSTTVNGAVSITGTPTVNVGNTAIPVNDAGQPQAVHGNCYAVAASTFVASCIAATVPAGKQLVVEMISYQLRSDEFNVAPFLVKAGLDAGFGNITIAQPNVFVFPVGTPVDRGFGNLYYPETRDVRIYLDEDQSLRIGADFGSANNLQQSFAFSGFLVNK